MIQVGDATDSVKQIGFAAAIALLCLLGIGVGLRYLFKYFTGRLDKKDEQIVALIEERHQDLGRMIESQHLLSEGQQRIVDSLTALADGLKGRRR